MKSTVVKRSVVLAGHKTSVSLEDPFWEGLKEIAKAKRQSLSELVSGIDTDREHANLSSAIRLFVLNHYQALVLWYDARHRRPLLWGIIQNAKYDLDRSVACHSPRTLFRAKCK